MPEIKIENIDHVSLPVAVDVLWVSTGFLVRVIDMAVAF